MYRRDAWIGAKAVQLNAPEPNVGAGLLAKAACQATFAMADIPLSRAGSLPQGMGVESEESEQGGDDRFRGVLLDQVAGVGDWVKLRTGDHLV
ncbi:hypothetical protein C1895_21615 [Pseudomonas sp. FW305-3-2-15-E-TSA4]|nr:hypothetical protein C1895_21615 [Pseudomonas sp. FW305-3-2-15-E-TSA4]